jgi:hypothetical protein
MDLVSLIILEPEVPAGGIKGCYRCRIVANTAAAAMATDSGITDFGYFHAHRPAAIIPMTRTTHVNFTVKYNVFHHPCVSPS